MMMDAEDAEVCYAWVDHHLIGERMQRPAAASSKSLTLHPSKNLSVGVTYFSRYVVATLLVSSIHLYQTI